MPRLIARLALLVGLRRADPAPIRSWRDPVPALCSGRPIHAGRALSTGEAP
ncbi:hypothetical protein MKK84_10150 [Methylobacterium sp. E-065]|uniref:hypothetical protein n=1 Tax=Methylobacterium sp. E-065 TaxID=2836583 RepID=UPI001FBBB3DF|nr:hypothetical protein [Methylobacterium sp. E-065]MCJ2017778.1 hypothetical protein [Methylobacterium sp. E-065]